MGLLLFNAVGYRFVFSILEKKATTILNKKIDGSNFDEANLVEIKIPLNMPYYSDKEYEAVTGEIEIDGKHLQYVKRKVSGNTLYLMCLPNDDKTNLVASKLSIEKSNFDTDKNKSNQKNPLQSLIKSVQIEYLKSEFNTSIFDLVKIKTALPKVFNSKVGNLFTPLTPEQPPEQRS